MKINKNNNKNKDKNKGFTLIEILVVIGILGILATVVLVAVNPSRQFKQARDSQRVANINTILNAIGQNIADHQGNLFCEGNIFELTSNSAYRIRTGGVGDSYDIASCLTPDYISKLPYDPSMSEAYYNNEDDYNTGYDLRVGLDGRLTIVARGELQEEITVTR